MNENPHCTLCPLHKGAITVCMKASYPPQPSMLILLDNPNFMEDRTGRQFSGDAADLVRWMLARMSIPLTEVAFEYVVKCYPPKGKLPTKKAERLACILACSQYRFVTLQVLMPRVVVGMGKLACEALTGHHEVGKFEGTFWDAREWEVRNWSPEIWISYSPNYALQSPGETPSLYRTLWQAAEHVGLSPVFNPKVPMFDWSDFIK